MKIYKGCWEIGARLGLDPHYVRRLIRNGRLQLEKLNGVWVMTEADAEAYDIRHKRSKGGANG